MPPSKLLTINEKLHFQVAGQPVPVPDNLREELEKTANEFFNEIGLRPPAKTDLPFFAYGLFKPGQLGFDSLREHTKAIVTTATMAGALYERDGVPLFVVEGAHGSEIAGALISFSPEQAAAAYQKIASIEPERQYRWEIRKTTDGIEANVLVATSQDGAHHIDDCEWDGTRDPHFNQALRLVESIKASRSYQPGSVEKLMELQMAYLLLWTAIERYTSLRYHLRKKTMAKVMHMADEPGFRSALKLHVTRRHEIYSTDAGKPEKLRPENPKSSLRYYYQIRCNVTHRGKALMTDAVLLDTCINELLAIFRETIRCAFEECMLKSTQRA